MMKITGLSHLFKWENLHNWWLTKYFFVPLYVYLKKYYIYMCICICVYMCMCMCMYKAEHFYPCLYRCVFM